MAKIPASVKFAAYGRRLSANLAQRIVDHIEHDGLTPIGDSPEGEHLIESYSVVETSRGAKVVTTKNYWRYVEYGHSTTGGTWVPAQPHVGPAIEAARVDGK